MASAEGCPDEDSTDALYVDDIQQPLDEFVCTHTLPQSVSVTRGSFMSQDVMIARGDVLLLQSVGSTSVTLSFADEDTGLEREIEVSPDIPYKFLVLPPKDSVLSDPDSSRSGRPISMVTYPTVADLLMDCPTYFEANSTYDDPYLPGFSVKPGDTFRYVRVVRDVGGDRMERLQCRTASDELVCLSTRCKGNFTVLRDETLYTLRELIDLARVPRRLQLAPENSIATQDAERDEAVEGEGKEDTDEKVPELPSTFSGVITMSRPQENVEVSPWDSPETSWSIPQNANLHVKLFSDTGYEEPVKSRRIQSQQLAAFKTEHEHKLPVHATLFGYTTPPDMIAKCLSDCREVIVHEHLRTQKLFVKDSRKDDFFAIDQSAKLHFVEIPRQLSSIFEMMSLPLGSQVQVLADIAADFPEPFILRYGDVLRVTKHDSSSWKFKQSATGDVPIVKCERIVQGGKPQKLKLPLDLEVNLVLMGDASDLRVTTLADLISGEDEIPGGDVSVLEGNGASYPPLPASLQILQVLTESELLISPLGATGAVNPIIKGCVKVPVRHPVLLGLKRKLEFPDGYFVMPPKESIISVGIEHIAESVYEELVQARKVATEYEDVLISPCRESEEDAKSQSSSVGRSRLAISAESIPRSVSSGTLERKRNKDRVKRISRALNPKNWHLGRGAAAPAKEQEDLPSLPQHPVSGILTLSLQPSQAADNDYMEDMGESSGGTELSFRKGSEVDHFQDDTYEDVNVSFGAQSSVGSKSTQRKASDHLSSVSSSVSGRGSLTDHPENVVSQIRTNMKNKPTENMSLLSQDDLAFDKPRPRRARARDEEGVERGTRHRRRKSEPCIGLIERKNRHRARSPDHDHDFQKQTTETDPPVDELEIAPRTRYNRTRSPAILGASENIRKSRSIDNVLEMSEHHQNYSLLAEASSTPERRRKTRVQPRDREKGPEKFTAPPSREKELGGCAHHESENALVHDIPSVKERQRKVESSQMTLQSSRTAERHQTTPPTSSPEKLSTTHEKLEAVSSPVWPENLGKSASPDILERQKRTDWSVDVGHSKTADRPRMSPPDPPSSRPRAHRRQMAKDSENLLTNPSAPERCKKSDRPGTPDRHRKTDSPSRIPGIPERRRKTDDRSRTPGTPERHRKADDPLRTPGTPERHRKTDDPSRTPGTPERRRKTDDPARVPGTPTGRIKPDSPSGITSTPETFVKKDSPGGIADSPKGRRKPLSPGHKNSKGTEKSEHLDAQYEQTWAKPLKAQSPVDERRQPKGNEKNDSVVAKPRRPRRKLDASNENLVDNSVDSLDTEIRKTGDTYLQPDVKDSTRAASGGAIPKKTVKGKPAIPPKPVISRDSKASSASRPAAVAPPVAPPRRRGARIGSVEAEMYDEGPGPKPVLGRRRIP